MSHTAWRIDVVALSPVQTLQDEIVRERKKLEDETKNR